MRFSIANIQLAVHIETSNQPIFLVSKTKVFKSIITCSINSPFMHYWRAYNFKQVSNMDKMDVSMYYLSSGAPEFILGFKWGLFYSIFSFICMFCRLLFVLLYFLCLPLCCLFLDIRILITPLVSSNSSTCIWAQQEINFL